MQGGDAVRRRRSRGRGAAHAGSHGRDARAPRRRHEVFTGDTLFKNSVGGVRAPGATSLRGPAHSIMDVLMALPPETVVRPGHTDPSTIGEEFENNAFVRVWRGIDPEGDEPCTAFGDPATLVLLGDDYDGGHKAWVRWPDGARRHRARLSGPARGLTAAGGLDDRRAGERGPLLAPAADRGARALRRPRPPSTRHACDQPDAFARRGRTTRWAGARSTRPSRSSASSGA